PRQIAHPCTVLIHDGKTLHPPVFRTCFVHEHDPTVEISSLAGEALINRIRNNVCDTSPIVGRRKVLLAVELLAGENIPETKLRLQPSVALASDAAGHKCLRIYRAPILKARHIIAVGDALNESSRID